MIGHHISTYRHIQLIRKIPRLCHAAVLHCAYANQFRERGENLHRLGTCPFCRHPVPGNGEESKMNLLKRVAVDDPIAFQQMGVMYYNEGDSDNAFRYSKKAAALGDADAHYILAMLYMQGRGVEKNKEKEIFHFEEAAIAGHPIARYNLAITEGCIGKGKREMKHVYRAVKHFIIAANLGCNDSIQQLKHYY